MVVCLIAGLVGAPLIIKKALEKIESIDSSPDDIFNVLKEVCLHFDVEQLALAVFLKQKNIDDNFLVYNTYPLGWEDHYLENEYYLHDPVFNVLQKIAFPFEWNLESFTNLSRIQIKLLNDSSDFGINSGVTIPLIPRSVSHGFVTLLNRSGLPYDALYSLSMIGNVCANKIMCLKRNALVVKNNLQIYNA